MQQRAKGLAKYIRYNEVSFYRGSVFIYFTITRARKIDRYTENFVIKRVVEIEVPLYWTGISLQWMLMWGEYH